MLGHARDIDVEPAHNHEANEGMQKMERNVKRVTRLCARLRVSTHARGLAKRGS